MRPSRCLATTCGLALACGMALGGGAACGGSVNGPVPVPALASSPAAADFFAGLRDAWRKPDLVPPAVLRASIETFLRRWPNDGLAPLARVYLALVALDLGDFAAADEAITVDAFVPAGTTRDLWTVACARRARLKGNAEEALGLLRPLVGKNVDPVTRSVFEKELTLAALATHRDYEAISYMDAWLRAASEEDADVTRATVAKLVEQVQKDVLVGSLEAMRAQRTTLGYGVEIERILSKRLVEIATTSGDAELARLLLDADGGALVVAGDAGTELGELATSRRGVHVVEGRTLGLLLPTELPALRDEAADVLRGVMWALGLPRGVRAGLVPAEDAGAPPVKLSATGAKSRDASTAIARQACAPLEDAPTASEPGPDDGIRLVTRDDAGSIDRTEGALDELVGEGASVVVAGLDPVTSSRALAWGASHRVTVVTLVPPDGAPPASDFAFVLGEARADVVAMLAHAAPALAASSVAPVVDASDVATFPAQGGALGPLTVTTPVSCDIPAARAGDPRFPIGIWTRERTHAWLVTGSPACAMDLLGELGSTHGQGVLGFTLEAAATPAHAASLRVVSAAAGVVPSVPSGDPRAEEVRRFSAALGAVGWWTALGRDAATLARVALAAMPEGTVSDPKAVATLHATARAGFSGARARLWTSESAGWTPARNIARTVCAVDVPAR